MSRFGTYLGSGVTVRYDSVQYEKKRNLLCLSFFSLLVQIKKNPSRCENTKYYFLFCFLCECTQIKADLYTVIINKTISD